MGSLKLASRDGRQPAARERAQELAVVRAHALSCHNCRYIRSWVVSDEMIGTLRSQAHGPTREHGLVVNQWVFDPAAKERVGVLLAREVAGAWLCGGPARFFFTPVATPRTPRCSRDKHKGLPSRGGMNNPDRTANGDSTLYPERIPCLEQSSHPSPSRSSARP